MNEESCGKQKIPLSELGFRRMCQYRIAQNDGFFEFSDWRFGRTSCCFLQRASPCGLYRYSPFRNCAHNVVILWCRNQRDYWAWLETATARGEGILRRFSPRNDRAYLQAFMAVFLVMFRALAICAWDMPGKRNLVAFSANC